VSGILILTAVELEARALARRLELPPITVLPFPAYGRGLLRVAPVGLRAGLLASRWPRLLAGFNYPLVVSAGVCGVLGPSGERLNVTPTRHRQATELAGSARGGTLVTSPEPVATVEAKAALFASSGALAVDMESSVILAHAGAAGCPTLVVRGVSDTAGESLPLELIDLMTPAGKLRPMRALALTVTRPRLVPRAMALRQATRRALTAVAQVLAALAASSRP